MLKMQTIILVLFTFIAGFASAMEEPKENIYPVVSHSLGGIGPAAWIGTQDGTFWVTYQFDDGVDEMLHDSLSWEIKQAPDALHCMGVAELPPTVYFVGVFETKQDPLYKRPILRVRKWFVIPPFYKLNSVVEGSMDPKQTQLKRDLDSTDFQIPVPLKEKTKGVDISKFVRFHHGDKHDPRLWAYPVLDINMKDRTISALTGSYPNAVLCSKFELMNEKSVIPKVEKPSGQIKNSGIKTWFLGYYDNKKKLFYVYDFINSDALLPPATNSSR